MRAEHDFAGFERLDPERLADWPLPMPPEDGDKEERGRVLIVAGSPEMPGVALLCATAALRAGAGKVTIATGAGCAPMVALAMPECRVIGLRENGAGGFPADAARALDGVVQTQDAVLIGPGMQDETSVLDFVGALVPRLGRAKLLLDAYAMGIVCTPDAHGLSSAAEFDASADASPLAAQSGGSRVLITPHAGELAHLTGADKAAISENSALAAQRAAVEWNCIVALKGAQTHIATPDKRGWRHTAGRIGLSASGTGDALAGLIVGLAARGASLEQAAAWGVVIHALAAERLEARLGPLGYMAREIAGEIPGLLHELRPSEG